MDNSVRHYLGYGYNLVQEPPPFGPPVLSRHRQEGKVPTLMLRDQAKLATHSGPPLALAFLRGNHSATLAPEQESSHTTPDRSQVPQADSPATFGLHNMK
jgi:hypothetical protein